MNKLCILMMSALFLFTGFAAAELPKQLANITLMEGYEHEKLQGIDSTVGKFKKKDGPELTYDIGPVRAPGQPGFGGDYRNRVAGGLEQFFKWRMVQTINGEEVHVGLKKDDFLLFSYPKRGINMYGKVSSTEGFAELMLMAASVPGEK